MRAVDLGWRRGFTLVELLVVIAIIGALVALLLPAVQAAREASRRMKCQNFERQIALATHSFHDANNMFPCAVDERVFVPNVWFSWLGMSLPYIEQQPLYEMMVSSNGNSTVTDQAHAVPLPFSTCPSDARAKPMIAAFPAPRPGPTTTTYVAITGLDRWGRGYPGNPASPTAGPAEGIIQGSVNTAQLKRPNVRMAQITDGTTNTLLIGEQPPGPDNSTAGVTNLWNALNRDNFLGVANTTLWRPLTTSTSRFGTQGGGAACPPVAFFQRGDLKNACSINYLWSFHPGGSNFAMGDGSVRFISYQASQIMLPLSTRDGGETVGDY